jgi:hypothetical protein
MSEFVQPGNCFRRSTMLDYSLLQRFHGAILGANLALGANRTVDGDQSAAVSLFPIIQRLTDRLGQGAATGAAFFPGVGVPPGHPVLALLPLWLYCHESWRQRQAWLVQLCPPDTDWAPLWLWGEAIAQVLRPQFQPAAAIPTLLDRWLQHSERGAPALPAIWHEDLTQVQAWLPQPHRWRDHTHALEAIDPDRRSCLRALYCFLATPTQSVIVLGRAQAMGDPLAFSLTGMLLGAHNGWAGLALNRCWQLDPDLLPTAADLAAQLLRSWAGELPPDGSGVPADRSALPLVLAPR